jgi:flagellin
MSSINTNLSAMTALQSLKATQNAMNKNQNQISSGLRVSEASHNASYWSIATTMKSDNGALGAVKDSIKQSKSMIDTFTSALDKSLTYLNKIKSGLVAAAQPGADLAKIQTEFNANVEGMKSAAGAASFNGQNWLAQATPGMVSLVTSYDGNSNTVGSLAIDTTKTNLFEDASAGTGGLLGNVAKIAVKDLSVVSAASKADTDTATGLGGTAEFDVTKLNKVEGATITAKLGDKTVSHTLTAADAAGDWDALATVLQTKFAASVTGSTVAHASGKLTITSGTNDTSALASFSNNAATLKTVDAAISKVAEASAMLGANKALLETQEEFIGVLTDSLTAGVSAFIDADMNEASTRNQALQTQQQLGVQALSMANQNSQMILKLFQ